MRVLHYKKKDHRQAVVLSVGVVHSSVEGVTTFVAVIGEADMTVCDSS